MTTPISDTALASDLRATITKLARRLRKQRADDSMSIGRLSTLGTLDRHGPLTPGELAAHERVQPPSMTRVVVALEGMGLVTRTPHPTDGRQVVLGLTDPARELLAAEGRARDAWLAEKLQALSPEDRAVLREAAGIMGKLVAG